MASSWSFLKSMFVICVLVLVVRISGINGQQNTVGKNNNNKLWILLDDTSVFSCRGIVNKVDLNERDVSIRNSNGRQVHYLEAPGEYIINFNNIRVQEPLPNLSGQMNGVLQVPIVDFGSVLNWDYPYELFPEKQLFGGYKCDKSSGLVSDGGKNYCRYCDLCLSTDQVEQQLNGKGHKYLPELSRGGTEQSFGKSCTQIDARTYTMQRTISLPDKQELERQANAQSSGIGGELKKRLNKGKGKMQMEIQLLSSDQKPATRDAVYAQSTSGCRCCMSGVKDVSCTVGGSSGGFGSCKQDVCTNEYAQKCVRGNTKKVACNLVQFNYQVTDNVEVVKQFLQKNNYQDEYGDFNNAQLGTNNQKQQQQFREFHPSGDRNSNNPNNIRKPVGNSAGASANTGSSSAMASDAQQRSCINRMTDDRFKRFCGIRWQQTFCCVQCNGC